MARSQVQIQSAVLASWGPPLQIGRNENTLPPLLADPFADPQQIQYSFDPQLSSAVRELHRRLLLKSTPAWIPGRHNVAEVEAHIVRLPTNGTKRKNEEVLDDSRKRTAVNVGGPVRTLPARQITSKRAPAKSPPKAKPRARRPNYIEIKKLGQGGQGTAYLIKDGTTGEFAVKKVTLDSKYRYLPHDELFFLRDALAPNPRIINLKTAHITQKQTELYLEFCSGGDLSEMMYNYFDHNVAIPEAFIWHVFLQLAQALLYIHHGIDYRFPGQPPRKGFLSVIHRDIKPANIFLDRAIYNPDHPGPELYPRVVLADFGLALQATHAGEEPVSDHYIGTAMYQPPEIPNHSPKGDVYSVGAIICELMCGYMPEEGNSPHAVNTRPGFEKWKQWMRFAEKSLRGKKGFMGYSDALVHCVGLCLEHKHEERVGSEELISRVREGMHMAEVEYGVKWEELGWWAWEK